MPAHARGSVASECLRSSPLKVGGAHKAVQMWHGRAQSRCRCGTGEPSPGADVAAAGPVSVNMWHGRETRHCGRDGTAPAPTCSTASTFPLPAWIASWILAAIDSNIRPPSPSSSPCHAARDSRHDEASRAKASATRPSRCARGSGEHRLRSARQAQRQPVGTSSSWSPISSGTSPEASRSAANITFPFL